MITAAIVGRLGKDAEVKQLQGGTVINFSVAVDVGYGDKKETLWIDCAKWGEKTGVAAYLKKGQQVALSGEPGIRKWEGGATMTLRVATLELIGSAGSKQQGDSAAAAPEQASSDLPF
jgi:single-strand DNA-binding protein